ncbi:MAG: L-arabinolactonase [Alphaproteobacteria bacterium MarineAlpha5_Bin9]|mgnify:CR=1 FL=1|nr:MAG: L-arabinolactonase [Alphaproteobacteria bacterium MarineAlpha5_Bin9]|tara:strand:+ start:1323 stop:2201 length:879 start_codon:yes stop_codon:yes gene_type:complete
MNQKKVKLLFNSKDILGESPIWVEEHNSLYWIDIKRKLIHKYNIRNKQKKTWCFNQTITCIAHIKKNLFIIGSKNGLKIVNLINKKITNIFNPEKNLPNNRLNDGKCDNKGRFFVGSMNEINNKKTGSLYLLDNDLKCKKIIGGFIISNGPTFSPDYKKIYFSETRLGKIYVANLNSDGSISNKKLFIKIPISEGKPDGMTTDNKGNIFVAIIYGSKINKYNKNGKKIDTIKLPISCPTSCVFGGKKFDILFITSASHKLSNKQKMIEPLWGSVLKIKLKTNGLKTNKFIRT